MAKFDTTGIAKDFAERISEGLKEGAEEYAKVGKEVLKEKARERGKQTAKGFADRLSGAGNPDPHAAPSNPPPQNPTPQPPRPHNPIDRKEEDARRRELARQRRRIASARSGGSIANRLTKMEKGETTFFILWLVVFIVDAIGQFDRSGSFGAAILLGYLVLALLAPLLLGSSYLSLNLAIYFGLSVLSWVMPWLVGQFLVPLNNYFALLTLITPVWLFFLAIYGDPDSGIVRFCRFWLTLWLIAAAIAAFQFIGTPELIEGGKLPVASALRAFGENVYVGAQNIWSGIVNPVGGLPAKLAQFRDDYVSDVLYWKQQTDAGQPSGVFIRDIRSGVSGGSFPLDMDVVLFADLEAATINDTQVYHVDTSCFTTNATGETYPDPIRVAYRSSQSVRCNLGPLPRGSHEVTYSFAFPFKTWGYTPLLFMEEEFYQEMAGQGEIDRFLSVLEQDDLVSAEPTTIYTQGPVSVALASGVRLPILLYRRDPQASRPLLSIRLDQNWDYRTKGEQRIRQVDRIELYVPKPFELDSCTPKPEPVIDAALGDESETVYVWSSERMRPDITYDRIDCFLFVPDAASIDSLLAGSPGAVRTFKTHASYVYEITADERVSVGGFAR